MLKPTGKVDRFRRLEIFSDADMSFSIVLSDREGGPDWFYTLFSRMSSDVHLAGSAELQTATLALIKESNKHLS